MTLIAENISFLYNTSPLPVLQDVSAEFCRKEITAITGPNGCGKTTLCRILVGILKPARGAVYLDGTDISAMSLAEVGKKIGYAMQSPEQQLFCRSVREEIEYGLHNLNLDPKEIEGRCRTFMDYFEIGRYQTQFPFLLSRGEKQRVVLAAILAMQPEYLIMDEPSSSLDALRKKALGNYLRKVKEELDCGILLVSHDMEFVRDYADRTLEMKRGGGLVVSASST